MYQVITYFILLVAEIVFEFYLMDHSNIPYQQLLITGNILIILMTLALFKKSCDKNSRKKDK